MIENTHQTTTSTIDKVWFNHAKHRQIEYIERNIMDQGPD